MALTNYTELQTAVANWLDDNTLSSRVPEFIALAEARLNAILPLRMQELDVPLTGTIGSALLALPADFVEPIALFLTTFNVQTLLTPEVAGTTPQGLANSVPGSWAIDGSNINLDVPCDAAHTFIFRYRKSFALSDAVPTNWLLTNDPAVYLFGSLVEACAFRANFPGAGAWKQRYDEAIAEVAEREFRSKAIGALRNEAADITTAGFNIFSG